MSVTAHASDANETTSSARTNPQEHGISPDLLLLLHARGNRLDPAY